MIVGVPKEIKNHERRVALTPSGTQALIAAGCTVLVERGAGMGSGFDDEEYESAGARMVDAAAAWGAGHEDVLVLKIKEPLPSEYSYLRPGLILFTFLHLAADKQLTQALMENNVTAIAYETVEKGNSLPLLTPMSVVAGKMAAQVAAFYSQKPLGGTGVLPGGIGGVPAAQVLILGGGVVGSNAARTFAGIGAQVSILDIDAQRLHDLEQHLPSHCRTLYSTKHTLLKELQKADVVIGAVLVKGGRAPCLITSDTVKLMKNGAVLVDVAIDQGGCTDISWPPTSHSQPVRYVSKANPQLSTVSLEEASRFVGGYVIVYVVPNMPGAYSRTSTLGITNATLPYILGIVKKGLPQCLTEDEGFSKGVNVFNGSLTNQEVAHTHQLSYVPLISLLD